MSYILEALKRAERERKLGQAPAPLEEVPAPQPSTAIDERRRWLLIGIVGIVLAGVAVYGYFRFTHRGHNPDISVSVAPETDSDAGTGADTRPNTNPNTNPGAAPAPLPSAVMALIERPAPAQPSADASIEDGDSISSLDDLTDDAPAADDESGASMDDQAASSVENGNERNSAAPVQPPPAQRSAVPAPRARGGAAPPVQRRQAPAPSLAQKQPAPDAGDLDTEPGESARQVQSAPANPESGQLLTRESVSGLRRFKEMPAAYRAEFPVLTVDVHVYNSDVQRRFVIVNGKRYREGDSIAEGPRIAQIVSDGIVFDWRGEKVLYALAH